MLYEAEAWTLRMKRGILEKTEMWILHGELWLSVEDSWSMNLYKALNHAESLVSSESQGRNLHLKFRGLKLWYQFPNWENKKTHQQISERGEKIQQKVIILTTI